ncbi:hypothetical protein RhiirA5_437173 [Rhizophagus irregularis]|uniref:Uncharacterized protein n=1 Tax=Rhizophagus irregularis TaxID=588596 RepID=A0A2N0NKV8_9GLOM|nr:hypothetical protein RhiirA5_437173 [Rhizophagus irregularis]PKC61392.1 hypothetical protein RhiirA1_466626 [Rhizophagus irregularis]
MTILKEQNLILHIINDVKICGNSSYQSWQRLLVLHPTIEWLSASLYLNGDNNTNEDSYKLKDCMLQNFINNNNLEMKYQLGKYATEIDNLKKAQPKLKVKNAPSKKSSSAEQILNSNKPKRRIRRNP